MFPNLKYTFPDRPILQMGGQDSAQGRDLPQGHPQGPQLRQPCGCERLLGMWPPLLHPPAHTSAYESTSPWPRQQNAGAGKTRSAQGKEQGGWGGGEEASSTGEQSRSTRGKSRPGGQGPACGPQSGAGLGLLPDGSSFHSIRAYPQGGGQGQQPSRLSRQ